MKILRILVVAILVLGHMALSGAVKAEKMTLEDFFRHAEFQDVAISPKGNYLAFTIPAGDRHNLAIIDITDPTKLSMSAGFNLNGGERPVNLQWVSDDRLVFESLIEVGALEAPQPTGRVYAIDADGSNRRQLFGSQAGSRVGRYMSIVSFLPSEPDWILIEHYAHDRPRPIAQRLNVNTARLGLKTSSPLNQGGFLADQQEQIRFAYGTNDDGEPEFAWRETEKAKWKTFKNTLGTYISPIGFSQSGESVYFHSQETGKLGVYEVFLATGEIKAVLTSDVVEVDQSLSGLSPFLTDAAGENLLGARFMDGKPEWRLINEEAKEAQWLRQLEGLYEDYYVHIYNWTADGTRALVSISGDVTDREYFLLDTEKPELRFIASAKSWIDPEQMSKVTPIRFKARDGVELNGYLTLPKSVSAEAAKDLPFVVYVHGGPHGIRDRWRFDPMVQVFAYHGFGVLQVNYRGSGGYGRDFETQGYGEWAAKMQDDITDGTHWIIEQGYADKNRVCLAGASYGGFSTLAGITKEPDLYACAWAFVGVYDLPLMKKEGNIPSFVAGQRYLDRVLGTDEEVLKERSPTTHVSKIKTPLFVVHGAEDTQAHFGQYHLLREKLKEANIPHEHLFVEGEGHGFYKVENNVMLMEKVLEFMQKNTQK